MSSILIADSGSTKTDWALIRPGKKTKHLRTSGMNPFFKTEKACFALLEEELDLNPKKNPVDEIVFYGAGIKNKAKASFIEHILKQHFGIKKVSAHSDMLGAARATCGAEKGICTIMGTGSNSCYYNGKKVAVQHPSLGFIVGDEGSGTYLGKRVLQYYFYNTFDEDLAESFRQKYGSDLPAILEQIYGKPGANRYLASFTEFLIEHRGHYMVENILEDAFLDFYQRHVMKYRESWKYPIHAVGAVAYTFKDILLSTHEQLGLSTGSIIQSPMEGLLRFHQ